MSNALTPSGSSSGFPSEPVVSGTPSTGQVLTASSATVASWSTPTSITTPVSLANGGSGFSASSNSNLLSTLGAAQTANNLSDLASASAARTNLGLGAAALLANPIPLTATTFQPMNFGEPLAVGEATMPRLGCIGSIQPVTQGLILTYWIAASTQTAGHIITSSQGTTAGTMTLAQIGIYSVNTATGALTAQLATTANFSSTGYKAAFTAYTNATSTWSQVAGTTYCVAHLMVGSGTFPTITGQEPTVVPALALPYVTGYVSGQSSLPSTVASASVVANPNGSMYLYAVVTP